MTRRLVADASAIVALLTDSGPVGQWVFAPCHELVDGALRPVAVVHLQRVALLDERLLRALQPLGRLAGEDAHRLLIAVDRVADEVVRREVADLLQDRRVDVA